MGPKHWMLSTVGLARGFGENCWDHRAEHPSGRAGTMLKIQLFSFDVSSIIENTAGANPAQLFSLPSFLSQSFLILSLFLNSNL